MADPTSPSAEPANTGSRRDFIGWTGRALLGLWGLGIAGALGAYLNPGGGHEKIAERIVRVGPLEDLKIGDARLVRHGQTPFWVARLDATRVVALSAVCTHVRCILDWDRERRSLKCPCHDGRFDLNGNVISGPPPKPLPSYVVAVRAGDIYVQL